MAKSNNELAKQKAELERQQAELERQRADQERQLARARRISELNNEINALKVSKQAYETMNSNIQEAVSQLNKAKSFTSEAYGDFGRYYTSYTAKEKIKKIKNYENDIDNIISTLQNTVLSESKAKIVDINYKIFIKERELMYI